MTNNEIETKWQKKWREAKLFESNPNEKEKLFITVAFPYPSGAMHVGHGMQDLKEWKATMYYSQWHGT